jgi:integrase
MATRTLQTEQDQGVEVLMRRPSDPIAPLIVEFIQDKTLARVREGTLKNYAYNLNHFDASLGGAKLGDLTPAVVKKFAAKFYPDDPDKGAYTARNKVLLLKSFAAWLAEQKLYYLRGGDSVLRDVKIPAVPKLGRKVYEDGEVKTLVRVAGESTLGLRDRAMLLLMLGCTLRSGEVRTLLLVDYIPAKAGEPGGHVVIRHSKTEKGLRVAPLDPAVEHALTRYIRYGRPRYDGTAAEPLFLRDDGHGPLSGHGMSSLRARLKVRAREAGLEGVMFHRARGYAAKRLQGNGTPVNVLMQIGGWESPEMIRRYVGNYDPAELKRFPTARLNEVIR